ncbi:MAG: S1C family serine protease [Gammaproteobacteria bacterium]|nr:S1C family serine protease [Gammaproteobacteria bacterium]
MRRDDRRWHRILALGAWVFAAAPFSGTAAAELDLDAVMAPVIALEARIPDDARTAPTLGTVRGGTGIVIDGAGLVLTIGYLIMEAAEVDLIPDGLGGGRVPADVVAWDQGTGLGLVRARRPLDIRPMAFGDSGGLESGDAVIGISWERSGGLVPSVVVERRNYAGYWEYLLENALFVAPIHPAFPGAALVDLDGRLVGVGGFALTDEVDEDEVVGTVFVPIDALKPVLAELLLFGRSAESRPWIGLYCQETDAGLTVRRVPAYGPAARAGIRAGDRVRSVAGTEVNSLEALYRRLWASARPGEPVTLRLERDEKIIELAVEAGDRYTHLRLHYLAK